jgi:hypothetical protein
VKKPEYDSCGRMRYNPEFHDKQFTPWLMIDERYLIENYAATGRSRMSFALGRTESTVAERVYRLRKMGKMPPFKKKHPSRDQTKKVSRADV